MSTPQTASIMMYTTPWCSECWRVRRLFAALGVPYILVNLDRDPQAADFVRRLNGGMQSVLTIIFPDGTRLAEPSNTVLEAHLQRYSMTSNCTSSCDAVMRLLRIPAPDQRK